MTCTSEIMSDGKLVPCSRPGIWRHPRYAGDSCAECKKALQEFFPLGWEKIPQPGDAPVVVRPLPPLSERGCIVCGAPAAILEWVRGRQLPFCESCGPRDFQRVMEEAEEGIL